MFGLCSVLACYLLYEVVRHEFTGKEALFSLTSAAIVCALFYRVYLQVYSETRVLQEKLFGWIWTLRVQLLIESCVDRQRGLTL